MQDGQDKNDILNKIAHAKKAFKNTNHLLITNSMALDVRKNIFIQIYIWSMVLWSIWL